MTAGRSRASPLVFCSPFFFREMRFLGGARRLRGRASGEAVARGTSKMGR
jgi:hypothetical protein